MKRKKSKLKKFKKLKFVRIFSILFGFVVLVAFIFSVKDYLGIFRNDSGDKDYKGISTTDHKLQTVSPEGMNNQLSTVYPNTSGTLSTQLPFTSAELPITTSPVAYATSPSTLVKSSSADEGKNTRAPTKKAPKNGYSVQVINYSSIDGIAKKVGEVLEGYGYDVSTGNASSLSDIKSAIIEKKDKNIGNELKEILGISKIDVQIDPDSRFHVVVIIGDGFNKNNIKKYMGN